MGLGELAGKAGGILALPGRLIKTALAKPLVCVCALIFAGICVFVPIITIFVVKSADTARKKSELPETGGAVSLRGVDADSIFLPEEPDFLPRALLRREPSGKWSVEDAAPYWTSPADAGENGLWFEKIEKTIDTLLENVR
jgi:hypothetical protein